MFIAGSYKNWKLGMTISFNLNIFGNKYFTVLLYEWDTFNILNKQKTFFCMGESL